MSTASRPHPSSYRDPSGFMYEKDGVLYRQVNKVFKEDFDLFITSGCYDKLVKKGLLIPHETIPQNWNDSPEWYATLKPERLPFISYPYEWSFDMLKDAALLTLQLVKESIASGLILKDATPFNIQWYNGRLVFIDTLSFEKYHEEEPWIAYRQFCECFLAPLLLMHYDKVSLQRLSLAYPDGIPLEIASAFLPRKSKFSLHTYLHIHLHAGVARKKAGAQNRVIKFSKQKLLNLVNSLESLVKRLKTPEAKTTWSEYYEEASQRDGYLEQKKKLIEDWVDRAGKLRLAADLGANDGEFSRLVAKKGIPVIAADFDPLCIDNLYRTIRTNGEKNIQPLIIDLSNPSPAIGVNGEERSSFMDRLQADLVLALALIHHLAIGKNIPLALIARFFASITSGLIIEFVPKEDPKVKEMLAQKKDIYTDYLQSRFEEEMQHYFSIEAKQAVGTSGRTLYFMQRKQRP